MATTFQRLYPKSGNIGFDGGLHTKFNKRLILDNESPDNQNVIYGNGTVETREGTTKLNTTLVGSYICDGLYTRHDNNGTQTMVGWWDGSLYALNVTTFVAVASALSIYTGGSPVYAAEYENYMFFGNGASIPYKYNGAEFTRHGIYPPTTTMTVVSNSSGGSNLSGDYRYLVTWVNSNLVESDVSPIAGTFTAAGTAIYLSDIPVAPTSYGVNSRRIYRTEVGGTDFLRLATISDNTTTTYSDNIEDSSLGAEAPTDQGLPPNYSVIVYHQARIFVIDPATNLVKYSEVGNPYVFKVLSFVRPGDTSGDIPTGLAVYNNSVYILCKNSLWMVYMPSADDADWQLLRVKTSYGSKSPKSIFYYNDKIMFGAMQNDKFIGFSAVADLELDPSLTQMIGSVSGSDLKSQVIEPDMFDIVESKVSNISSIVYKNRAYITATYGSGASFNNRIFVFDFSIENLAKKQNFAWALWSGLNAADFTIYDGDLYYASSNATGFVYKMLDGTYNDDGAAIDSYYWTKEFKLEEGYWKDFRFANITYELPGDYYMNFTVRLNSDIADGTTEQIDLNPGGSLWGTFVWGRDDWGGGSTDIELKKPLGAYAGKSIQLKFDNQNKVDQKFKIISLNFIYNLKGRR